MLRAVLTIVGLTFATVLYAHDVQQHDTEIPQSMHVGVNEDIVAAAKALLASAPGGSFSEELIGYSMKERMLLPFDSEAREDWSYWPQERIGLQFDLMHAEQRALTQELLWAVLSPKGYHKVLNIMQLENILAPIADTGFPRGIEHYTVVFFGEPSMDKPWAWRFEGHHVSFTVTMAPGGLSVTPSFLGADPADVRVGQLAGMRVLRIEEDTGRALINSLNAEQRAKAMLAGDPAYNEVVAKFGITNPYDVPWDLISSNILKPRDQWDAWKTILQPDGIAATELNDEQRKLLRRIVDEVVTTYRPEIAQPHLQAIELDALSFAWIGSTEPHQPHYYRIQGPDFLFEYDNVQSGANHIHQVWRSRSDDFGADLLKRHYEEAH